jgi:hypothetical protein
MSLPNLRSINISFCAVMNKHGLFNYNSQTRDYNASLFMEFIEEVFEMIHLNSIEHLCVILYNVPFTKEKPSKKN